MKKFLVLVLAALIAFNCIACDFWQNGPTSTTPTTTVSKNNLKLTVYGEKLLNLTAGELYKITVSAKGTDKGVEFRSSDDSIVSVDDYGNLDLKKAGTAIITVALVEDPSVKEEITVNVTKTFFFDTVGYKNGDFDLTNEDEGLVQIKGGQTQILVTEGGQCWYFKVNLEHTKKYTNDDAQGRYGVGSFYVNDSTPIGEVMAWFGFKPDRIYKRTFIPYVGGWRVQTSGQDPEIEIGESMDCNIEYGATFELIRYGTMHYITITGKDGAVAKYSYDCPSLEGKDTYPGIYSQQQIINVYNYEVTTDENAVLEKLNAFQSAEDVQLNGIGDTLYAGNSYDLSATVLPTITFDKSVTYTLSKTLDGVTLKDGVLTIADNVSGEITVTVTANSDTSVSTSKTYKIAVKPASSSDAIDTGAIIGNAKVNGNGFSFDGNGEVYLPLLANGSKWSVSLRLSTSATSGRIGLLAATNGCFDYVDLGIVQNASKRQMSCGILGGNYSEFAYLADGASTSDVRLTVVKDGDSYYIIVNDRLIRKVSASISTSDLIPVLYAQNAAVTVSDIAIVTDAAAIDAKIAEYDMIVGAYVTEVSGRYTIAAKDFGSASDINWPPVNDYQNGLKSNESFTGDFEIEFTFSDLKPMTASGGEYDSKLLVYLRSESTTASLQFVIKGTSAAPTLAFCPNLNDATWTEYPIEGIDLLSGSYTVKIVKRANLVEVYLNGARVFEGNSGLANNGFWSNSTVCTPGIGTFRCGVTISDVTFKEV